MNLLKPLIFFPFQKKYHIIFYLREKNLMTVFLLPWTLRFTRSYFKYGYYATYNNICFFVFLFVCCTKYSITFSIIFYWKIQKIVGKIQIISLHCKCQITDSLSFNAFFQKWLLPSLFYERYCIFDLLTYLLFFKDLRYYSGLFPSRFCTLAHKNWLIIYKLI